MGKQGPDRGRYQRVSCGAAVLPVTSTRLKDAVEIRIRRSSVSPGSLHE